MSLVIFCPSAGVGGTGSLFSRAAEYWHEVTGEVPTIVDFKDGVIVNYLKRKNITFHFREYKIGDTVRFNGDDVVLASLLPGRRLGYRLLAEKNTKFVLWMTHPQDAFKWLPFFQIGKSLSERHKKWFARCVHPLYITKLKKFIQLGINSNGLLVMDSDSLNALKTVFDCSAEKSMLPIFTDIPSAVSVQNFEQKQKVLKFVWVGRIADFKWRTIKALSKDIDSIHRRGTPCSFDIIGDGAYFSALENYVRALGGVNIHMHGALPIHEVEAFLLKDSYIFCGHGTAILEAAKLGLPCMVADGLYFSPDQMKYRWLTQLPIGDVGSVLYEETSLAGETFRNMIESVDLSIMAKACLCHWGENHNPKVGLTKLSAIIKNNTFTYEQISNTGVFNFGFLGGIVVKFKRWYTRYKY